MSRNPNSAAWFSAKAPAKINLGLHIVGKRSNGYHTLVSLMVPVSLCDELQFELIPRGIEIRCPNSDLPTNEENLVYRAAQEVLDASRRDTGVRIELVKNIPISAGLGGGSSDAATTLMVINHILGSPLKQEDLYHQAVNLGADVPFFLLGRWAVAQGIGDFVTPVDNVPTLWTVLIRPHIRVSTRWAYENLTLTTRPNGSKFNTLRSICAEEMTVSHHRLLDQQQLTFEDILPLLINDFEPLVFRRHPELHGLRNALLAAGARAAPMTGSGPTLVGLFISESEARAAYDILRRNEDAEIYVSHTLDTRPLAGK
jgi:4-diphosphocytidyl-2-C-methyl-D-erythritol kinase